MNAPFILPCVAPADSGMIVHIGLLTALRGLPVVATRFS